MNGCDYDCAGYRWWRWCLLGLCLLMALPAAAQQDEAVQPEVAEEKVAPVLEIKGPIGPATSDYVLRALSRAEQANAPVLILRLDTPGGLDSAMRQIIKAMLSSPVPVVVYVAPSGSRAASAGTYILYASHVAAMAPSTNLGSATPVKIGGMPGSPSEPRDRKNDKEEGEAAPTSAMERKVLEDAVAYIRGLAELRGRNAEWAEAAVREAVNLTASVALEKNVIDLIAEDVDDLLTQVDGRTVKVVDGERTLDTEGITVAVQEPDWRTRLLSVITNPNVAYFLLLVGFYGIIFELASPGAIYPGVIGAICLLLALFAFQVLPINYAGLALMILGLLFLVAEAFVPSFGVLGLGGMVAFVFGSIILLDNEHLRLSLPVIGGTALFSLLLLSWALTRFVSLHGRTSPIGEEALVASEAVALEDFEGGGRVRLQGESWRAHSAVPIQRGQRVRVTAVDGLTLEVEPLRQGEPS